MSIVSRGAEAIFTSTLIRKAVHTVFSLLLLIPFTHYYREFFLMLWGSSLDPTLLTFALLLFISATINSIQIRVPNLREKFLRFSADVRRRFLESIETISRNRQHIEAVEGIVKALARYEEKFFEFISVVERDYELRYGYIGITFAILSITMSYVLFGYHAVYGILALAIVDSLSAIVTLYTSSRRRKLKHSGISIATTFTVFALLIYIFTHSMAVSAATALTAVLTEILSPEDNLTLPILTSAAAYLLGAPAPVL